MTCVGYSGNRGFFVSVRGEAELGGPVLLSSKSPGSFSIKTHTNNLVPVHSHSHTKRGT